VYLGGDAVLHLAGSGAAIAFIVGGIHLLPAGAVARGIGRRLFRAPAASTLESVRCSARIWHFHS